MSVETFPVAGVRARLLARFERDLGEWLATPEGGFAAYCAERDRVTSGLAVSRDIDDKSSALLLDLSSSA